MLLGLILIVDILLNRTVIYACLSVGLILTWQVALFLDMSAMLFNIEISCVFLAKVAEFCFKVDLMSVFKCQVMY